MYCSIKAIVNKNFKGKTINKDTFFERNLINPWQVSLWKWKRKHKQPYQEGKLGWMTNDTNWTTIWQYVWKFGESEQFVEKYNTQTDLNSNIKPNILGKQPEWKKFSNCDSIF